MSLRLCGALCRQVLAVSPEYSSVVGTNRTGSVLRVPQHHQARSMAVVTPDGAYHPEPKKVWSLANNSNVFEYCIILFAYQYQ